MNNYLLPFDVFERHKFIVELIDNSATILDVGGGANALSSFLKNSKVTVVNLKGSEEFEKNRDTELIFDGEHLPFKDNYYDVVTSVDVLEHIPKNERKNFVKELLRVAIGKVIISAPLGTKKHIEYEKEMLFKNNIKYLKEHVEMGLPTLDELKEITKNYKTYFYFSGNLNIVKFLFTLQNSEIKLPIINKIFYYLKILINLLFNILGYRFLTNLNYSESINRVYLVIHKQ